MRREIDNTIRFCCTFWKAYLNITLWKEGEPVIKCEKGSNYSMCFLSIGGIF